MKRNILALFILLTSVASFAEAKAQTPTPTIIKSTLYVRADRMLRYWKQPNTDNYWSWMPEVQFTVAGPIADASYFTIEFTMPDGKPWYSVDVNVQAIGANEFHSVETPEPSGHQDKRGIIETGTFGFKIRFRNGLSGIDQEFYKGRFKVNKFHKGNDLPAFKNQFEFYVDQDWTLPIGYLWLNYLGDKDAPPLQAAMWFRGDCDNSNIAAYVYYNGKQIASTKQYGTAHNNKSLITSGNDADPRWELWTFTWNNVRGYNTDANRNILDQHMLYSNPGNYEIKVLRDGDLVRTAVFTVGKDGKIADNGIAAQNKFNTFVMILPVKILGTKDGKWDTMAWKTEAFYGNPLSGFSVQ